VVFDLPHHLVAAEADRTFATALASIGLAWTLHALLLLPVDMLGGAFVVRERPGVLRWAASWLRGVTVQWFWFALAAALLMRTAQQFGHMSAMMAFVLLQLVLLTRQELLATLASGLRARDPSSALRDAATAAGIAPDRVREVETHELSFVGAWTGAAAGNLWVPAHWVKGLTTEQLVVALARRRAVITLGLRGRGVLVALAWNTLGFGLASSAPHADLVTAAGFVSTMAWFTLWSFLGVLILPTLSRPAVTSVDLYARRAHDPALVAETITRLDGWQDDEAERSAGVEMIFHPVPSRGARVRALASHDTTDSDSSATGAWHATRMMLYLSWAGLGGLSRAVHCNVGRPAVWVMLPGD